MEDSKSTPKEIPFKLTSNEILSINEYQDLLEQLETGSLDNKLNNKNKIIRPNPGELFIVKNRNTEDQAKIKDGYHWHRDGGRNKNKKKDLYYVQSRYFKVAYRPTGALGESLVTDGRFKLRIFFLLNKPGLYSIIHYCGVNDFFKVQGSHANSKSEKPFVPNRLEVKEEITERTKVNGSDIKVYADIKKSKTEVEDVMLDLPRDVKQVSNRRYLEKQKKRTFIYDWFALLHLVYNGFDFFIKRIMLGKSSFPTF